MSMLLCFANGNINNTLSILYCIKFPIKAIYSIIDAITIWFVFKIFTLVLFISVSYWLCLLFRLPDSFIRYSIFSFFIHGFARWKVFVAVYFYKKRGFAFCGNLLVYYLWITFQDDLFGIGFVTFHELIIWIEREKFLFCCLCVCVCWSFPLCVWYKHRVCNVYSVHDIAIFIPFDSAWCVGSSLCSHWIMPQKPNNELIPRLKNK